MNLSVILGRLLEICDASKAAKEQIRSWCKKADKDADEVISYVEGQFPDSNNKQLAAARWICAGYEPKFFGQALYICEQKKLDPMHQNPEDLVRQNPDIKPKDKAIDPDTVLTDRQEDGEGNVTYAARDEDREVLRQIINTHYGKDASPWCLLQGDRDGELTEVSKGYWRSYNAYPKRVAFRDGKLLAFSAGQNKDMREWWDRFDRSFPFIPYDGKTWEGHQGQYTIKSGEVYVESGSSYRARLDRGYASNIETSETNVEVIGNSIVRRGVKYDITKEDDKYYYVDNAKASFRMDKDTLKLDGLYERHYDNGRLALKCTFKNGKEDGLYERHHDNGQLWVRCTYKDGKKDGTCESYHKNGQLWVRCTYKDDKYNGLYERHHDNGQLEIKCTYKNDERDGLYAAYSKDGQLVKNCIYKDDKYNGLYEEYYDNGQLEIKCTYKDGKKDGTCESYHKNGQLRSRCEYKNGFVDGLYEDFSMDGKLRSKAIYKDGEVVKILKW